MTSADASSNSAADIVETIRSRITEELWKPGQRITSEYALSKEFGVCRATVTKALKELEREGLLIGMQGKGRFVTDQTSRPRTWTVGVVISNMDELTHPNLTRMMGGMREVLLESDYHLKLTVFNADSNRRALNSVADWLNLIDPPSIDGAIIATREVHADLLGSLARFIPMVRVQEQAASGRIAAVQYDFRAGAKKAVEHLLQLGHRHIGLITITPDSHQGNEQSAGARDAVHESGMADQIKLDIFEASRNRKPDGRQIMDKLIAGNSTPTALLCGSDELFIGAYRAAIEAGLTVPGDLSMIGWNDTIPAEQVPVSVTTVRPDHFQMGLHAMRLLLRMIEGAVVESKTMECEFITRSSTAAPRG